MRGVKACSKRSFATLSLALLLPLIVIIVLSQGRVTSRAERDSGDLISLNVQAIKIRDPTNGLLQSWRKSSLMTEGC